MPLRERPLITPAFFVHRERSSLWQNKAVGNQIVIFQRVRVNSTGCTAPTYLRHDVDPRDPPTKLYLDTSKLSPNRLSSEIPPTPEPSHPLIRRFWGYIHWFLLQFSIRYCRWVGIPFDNQIVPLPFGLLLKWSDGTRLEEVLATKVYRAAGIPTPKIISYGEHPDMPHAPVSILMTRLPGREIGQAYKSLSPEAQTTALTKFKLYLSTIRGWTSP